MREIPDSLRGRPFSRREALAAGITARVLEGRRFARIHDSVWRTADHVMSDLDWVEAARLALPVRAKLTGITRLQRLGLDYGPRLPAHFVVEGDLHREIDHAFLHRTKRLPPHDSEGICVAGAFVSYCDTARVIDAIKVGDWLLHREHLTREALVSFAFDARWRAGALEALWVSNHLDGRARSLKESETRAVLGLAGLPAPEVNVVLDLPERVTVIPDLLYPTYRAVVEYEGRQHLDDPLQIALDIDRYAVLRRCDVAYVQATNAKLHDPRRLVREVHQMLVTRGYDGPDPVFGPAWKALFGRVEKAMGSTRRDFIRAFARGEVS